MNETPHDKKSHDKKSHDKKSQYKIPRDKVPCAGKCQNKMSGDKMSLGQNANKRHRGEISQI